MIRKGEVVRIKFIKDYRICNTKYVPKDAELYLFNLGYYTKIKNKDGYLVARWKTGRDDWHYDFFKILDN